MPFVRLHQSPILDQRASSLLGFFSLKARLRRCCQARRPRHTPTSEQHLRPPSAATTPNPPRPTASGITARVSQCSRWGGRHHVADRYRSKSANRRIERRDGLDSRRHVPHGLGRSLSGRSAGPSRDGRRLLDRPHAGDEPPVQGIRQGDRPRHLRRDSARSEGLSRRAAAHALCRLAGVLAAATRRRICATGASGGPS